MSRWCLSLVLIACLGPGQSSAVAADYTINERTHKRLLAAQDLMAAQRFTEALEALQALEKYTRNRRYETALVNQLYGYVYATLEQVPAAIKAFGLALAPDVLPKAVQAQMWLQLAQLNLSSGQSLPARAAFQAWTRVAERPAAEAFALGGAIEAELGDRAAAIRYLKQAIALSETPRENWYRFLLAQWLADEQWRPALETQKQIIALFGHSRDWIQLAWLNIQLQQTDDALAALQTAWTSGYAMSSGQIHALARFALAGQNAWLAFRVLAQAVDAGRVPRDRTTLSLMFEAASAAREWQLATDSALALARLTAASGDYERVMQMLAAQYQWQAIEEVFQAAQQQELPTSAGMWLWLGRARVELKRLDQAAAAYRRVKGDARAEAEASQWLAWLAGS